MSSRGKHARLGTARGSINPHAHGGLVRAALALALALALAAEPVAAQEALWDRAWLPLGFHLELATGVVGSRPAEGPGLSFNGEALVTSGELFSLLGDGQGGLRPGDVALEELSVRVGAACAFRLDNGRWGRVAVTALDEQAVTLEYLLAAPGAESVRRSPAELSLADRDGGLLVSWPELPGQPGNEPGSARYRVLARYLHRPSGGFRAIQVELGGSSWLHGSADGSDVIEYWVARIDAGDNFGQRLRGVPGALGPGEEIGLDRDATLNLLTGEVNGARSDCHVSYLSNTSVHLEPDGGSRVLSLSKGGGAGAWEVPAPGQAQYREQRTSLMVGGALAFRLAEGVFARVELVGIRDGEALIRRQISLEGGRVFPPKPAPPSVERLAGGGFRLSFKPLPVGLAGGAKGKAAVEYGEVGYGPGVSLVLEIGEADGSWREIQRSAAGQRTLELPAPGSAPGAGDALELIHCRARQELSGGLSSAPGDSIDLLPADDGSAEAAAVIIEQALGELANGNFSQRRRAQRALELLGSRAFERLEETLGSGNPDLAAAAQEVLVRSRASSSSLGAGPGLAGAPAKGGGESRAGKGGPERTSAAGQSGMARAILLARARVLGLELPPIEWTHDEPRRRALALLRAHADPWASWAPGSNESSESSESNESSGTEVAVGTKAAVATKGTVGTGGSVGTRGTAGTGEEHARAGHTAAWSGMLAESDPEATVRQLAVLLDSVPGPGARDPIPWERWVGADGSAHGLATGESWGEFFRERGGLQEAELVLARLAREIPGSGLAVAEAYLVVAHDLWSADGSWDGRLGAWGRAELALRLVERHREAPQPLLLAAARELCGDPGARIRAWRDLARLGSARAWGRGGAHGVELLALEPRTATEVSAERETRHIEGGAGAGAELAATLRELRASGRTGVDLILGPGVYEAEQVNSSCPVEVSGLRIIGAAAPGGAPVELRMGFHVGQSRGVVFENVDILASGTTALILTGSEVVLRGCRLRGRDTCIMTTDSDILLDRCEVLPPTSGRLVYSLRSSGRGAVLVRASLLAAGSLSIMGDTRCFMERSVLSAGTRNAIEGGRSGRVVLVNCLIESSMSGLSNVAEALLEGVVVRCGRGLIQTAAGPIRICPEHVLGLGSQSQTSPEQLEYCPLSR